MPRCGGLFNQYAPFTAKVFAALPKLKLIARYGVGVDNIDLQAATAHGVQVCNVPDYGTQEVAAQALALMMELIRKPGQASAEVKAGYWDYARYAPIPRISTLTVGIIGLGRIGSAFAKIAHALGCQVVAYDIELEHIKADSTLDFVELLSFDEVLAQADVLSLHCDLNADTLGLMNAHTFAKMKPGAWFINVARGGLVKEPDLAQALNSGHLRGAGIDVTCHEPLEDTSPLRKARNIVITPHIAWYSVQAAHDLKRKCAEEAVRAIKDEKPRCPVNKLA